MTDQKKVLITDRFSQEALLTLSQQPFLSVQKTESPNLFKTDLSQVNGLIIRSRTIIDDELLSKAKKLQVIITATSGFDHIDLDAANKWGVTVMFTPEANVESAAQMTWALVLACANKIPQAHKALKAGEWNRDALVGLELHHKTYGIVGLGRIGKRVADMANAFGMSVIAYDPYADESSFRQVDAERVAYEEILKRSDVLSYHVPATGETKAMLNRSHFEYIHRGLILVNTSRGSVIHELDLCEALEQKWLGAVGLDVFEKEPLPRTSKLLQHSNVVVSPHCGANTQEAFAKASEQAALKLIRFFVDSSTSDTLPPKAAWYGAVPPWKKQES
ncbi:MAG: NAD(P)-dependent oxidoreductase [Pseudobdellovibrionaceae bacterium]